MVGLGGAEVPTHWGVHSKRTCTYEGKGIKFSVLFSSYLLGESYAERSGFYVTEE